MDSLWPPVSDNREKYFELSRSIHNSLTNRHERQLPENFTHHVKQVAEIIARCNAEHLLQPHLAHSHFHLNKGEMMLGEVVKVSSESDLRTPIAVQTAPVSIKHLDLGAIFPHILGWATDETGNVFAFPYQYRMTQNHPAYFDSEALRLTTDYVKKHGLQHLITLEIVLGSSERMVEFMFSSYVFSISSWGVSNASNPAHGIDTSWKVEKNNGSMTLASGQVCFKQPGQPHIPIITKAEEELRSTQPFEMLKQEGIWDTSL